MTNLALLLLCSLSALHAAAQSADPPARGTISREIIRIHYGKNGSLAYDLSTGTLDIFEGREGIFAHVFASVKIEDRILSSKDYRQRKYSKTAILDGFGKGEKHVIDLSGDHVPPMRQVFYIYPGLDYFFTTTEVTGTKLRTNYLAPFEGEFKSSHDPQTLFIPFDNDTFISYEAIPLKPGVSNTSAEAGVVYDNGSRNGWVVGSVEHEVWKTGVRTLATDSNHILRVLAGFSEEAVTRDKIPHGEVVGDTLRSPLVFVGAFSDWREGMEAYGRANRIAEPPFVFTWTKPAPVGWNSWGVLKDKLNFEKAIKVADFFADSLTAFRTGHTAYIDLDSYWDYMVGEGGDYSKLKAFADHCKARGLEPGVYWAPFTDWGWKGGPGRKVEGSNYTFGDLWTRVGDQYHELDGARAMDPTHPGTQQRIATAIKKLKDCGFKMIKIDFLGHAAVESTKFYDSTVRTGMQAYRKGMEFLISQLGDQMLIYAAISPSLATGRYVHTRRIACDAFKSIHDTKYTLNSVSYGWWQTYVYPFIDADHIVFSDEQEGANHARMISGLVTGSFITGDDFSEHGPWSSRAQRFYQDPELLKIVENGKAFRPVEGNTGKGASEMFVRRTGNFFYLAVFNYSAEPKIYSLDAGRVGLPLQKHYKALELISGQPVSFDAGSMQLEVKAADAALYKFELE